LKIRDYSYGIDTGVHRDYWKDGEDREDREDEEDREKTGMGMLTALITDAVSCDVKQVFKYKGKWILKE
jgi:hypothetical protein